MLPLPGHPSGHSQFDNWHVLQGPATTVGSSTSLTREQVVGVALCDQLLELLIYNLVLGSPALLVLKANPVPTKRRNEHFSFLAVSQMTGQFLGAVLVPFLGADQSLHMPRQKAPAVRPFPLAKHHPRFLFVWDMCIHYSPPFASQFERPSSSPSLPAHLHRGISP
ncbi:unnamed protein product [Effrenium voratum]|uniref:Uncharacterized protein n=1 Tax=Effrenium voratum TaxID=2562239 RepID=A0AA36JRT8_9DINO|nr:unnamed protein product [Effrenium voratum]